jgi:hypothetical protein
MRGKAKFKDYVEVGKGMDNFNVVDIAMNAGIENGPTSCFKTEIQLLLTSCSIACSVLFSSKVKFGFVHFYNKLYIRF